MIGKEFYCVIIFPRECLCRFSLTMLINFWFHGGSKKLNIYSFFDKNDKKKKREKK